MIYLMETKNKDGLKGFFLRSDREKYIKQNGGRIIQRSAAEKKYGAYAVSMARINAKSAL